MRLIKSTLFAGAALTLLLGACNGKKDAETAETEENVKYTVKVAVVEERDVADLAVLTASVEADKINNITSNTPNRIKQILVDEGMSVSKGQKLVVLDDVNTTSYQLQVDNAKANLRNIETNYERAVELLKIGGARSSRSTRWSCSSSMQKIASPAQSAPCATCRKTRC